MRTVTANDQRFGFVEFRLLAIVAVVGVVLGGPGGPMFAGDDPAGTPAPGPGGPTPPQKQGGADTTAKAQPPEQSRVYLQLPADEKKQEEIEIEQKKQRLAIRKIRTADTIAPAQQAALEKYYKEYALARWTWKSKWTELPTCRKELRNDLWNARGRPAHAQLVQLALEVLTEMAKEVRHHPATRFNAMLAIGELNERESSKPTEYPVPLPQAIPVLLEALNDTNQHDAVRVAALLGIYRHAMIPTAAQVRDTEVSTIMRTLAQAKPASGRSVEGHAWMRARAIDTLGVLGDVGPQNAVVEVLAAVVADQADNLLPRSAAARALGNLNYQGSQGLDPSQLATGLGQLAFDACVAELAAIEEENKQRERKKKRAMRPGMGPMGSEMMGPLLEGEDEEYGEAYDSAMEEAYDEGFDSGMGDYPDSRYPARGGEEEEKEDATVGNRRRLKAYVNAVLIGLTGTEGKYWNGKNGPPTDGVGGLATAPPHSDFVNGLLAQVDSLFKFCDTKDLEREDFRAKLEEQVALLGAELDKSPFAAAAAQPSSDQQPTDTQQPADGGQPAGTGQPAASP